MSIIDAKSITLELYNNSFLYLSSLTTMNEQLEILATNTTTPRYGSSRFYSIMINIGTSNKSIVGYDLRLLLALFASNHLLALLNSMLFI
jgi:hypothetical protein